MFNGDDNRIRRADFRSWPLAAAAFSLLFLGSALASPHAWVDQPFWNFGTVTNVDELTHAFVVRNTGDTPLVLTRIVSSCSACLTVDPGGIQIPPNGSNTIHCRLDTRILNGPISRAIAVECNDPKNPAFALGISGVVVPAFQVVPAEIVLDISRGQLSASANIWPELPLHGGLTQLFCDDSNIEAVVSPGFTSKFLVSVRVKTVPRRGDSVAHLNISSDDSNDPVCRLSVLVHYPNDLELVPDHLVFEPRAEEQDRMLAVKQHGTNFLTLVDAISPSKKFHCEIEAEPFSRNYWIYLTAVGQESFTNVSTALVLKLKNNFNQITNINVPIIVEDQ